jgi:hypothetical protein
MFFEEIQKKYAFFAGAGASHARYGDWHFAR